MAAPDNIPQPESGGPDASSPQTEAELIDGKQIAADVRAEITEEVKQLGGGVVPGLAVIQVGSRPDSSTYVRMKTKAANECGFSVQDVSLAEDCDETEIVESRIEDSGMFLVFRDVKHRCHFLTFLPPPYFRLLKNKRHPPSQRRPQNPRYPRPAPTTREN